MNQSMVERAKQLLAIPTTNVALQEKQTINKGQQQLFAIAGLTRKTLYRYATIGSTGNINLHVMSVFKHTDNNQSDPQYRNKNIWASVNMDSQRNPNDPTQFRNNNLGNLLALMKPSITLPNATRPSYNHYNNLILHHTRIKQALIPASIDDLNLEALNAPAITLHQEMTATAELEIDRKDKVALNIEAYNEYTKAVLELVEQGKLVVGYIFINPTPNSVTVSSNLDDSMDSKSNPWMSINEVFKNVGNLSRIPTLNNFRATVQIIEASDLSLLNSDNDSMLGKRNIWTDSESGRERNAISKVAIIKDYNSDTPILVSLTDPITNNANARSRVDAFEALLDKGITTFTVEGSLSPVVRTKGTNASRNGDVFFELHIDDYDVYQSTSVKQTLDIDAFSDLGAASSEGDEEAVQTFVADTDTPDDSNKDEGSDLTNDFV